MPSLKDSAKPGGRNQELDPRIVRALSHPIRHKVLVALNERVASPKELAAELGEPLGNVSYHTRVLAQLGCIELVSTTQRRGALEHHYRAVMRPFFDDAAWAQIPVSTRRSLFDGELDRLWNDAVEAAKDGGFDQPQAHVSVTALDLDEQGFAEVARLLASVVDRALEIQAEAAARRADGAQPAVRSEIGILHFERSAGEPSGKSRARGKRKKS
jgi:DNA-binding transcriptional ArsR family regulator